jgi:hypothetical protein
MLKFPDGTKVAVTGLSEILADLYAEGRPVNLETSEEIVNRLEKTNYIPSSERTRREYRQSLLKEYSIYMEGRTENGPQQPVVPGKAER